MFNIVNFNRYGDQLGDLYDVQIDFCQILELQFLVLFFLKFYYCQDYLFQDFGQDVQNFFIQYSYYFLDIYNQDKYFDELDFINLVFFLEYIFFWDSYGVSYVCL